MKNIGISGHRDILRYFNNCNYEEALNILIKYFESKIIKYNPDKLISGMALGVDEAFAFTAIKLNLKLKLCIPHNIEFHKKSENSAKYYDYILNYKNLEIEEVSKYYKNKIYKYATFARNQSIIDNSDLILIFKRFESTGTNHCLNLCKKQSKNILMI